MRIALALAAVLLTAGCTALMVGNGPSGNAGPAARTAGDSGITDAIERRLAADPRVAQANIVVTTVSGRVTLSGSVATWAGRERAGEVARSTAGVVSVNNRLTVAGNREP